jgi:hypothetical protein
MTALPNPSAIHLIIPPKNLDRHTRASSAAVDCQAARHTIAQVREVAKRGSPGREVHAVSS